MKPGNGTRCKMRYDHYVSAGVPKSHVAALKPEWLERVEGVIGAAQPTPATHALLTRLKAGETV